MRRIKVMQMKRPIKFIIFYIICLIIISACWVGFEYILEGVVHSSDVDGIVAIILSYFITDKFIGGNHYVS